MHGSTVEAMSKAVEECVVMCYAISEAYKESTYCRMEAQYAHQQEKDMAPLMEDGYQAKGWRCALSYVTSAASSACGRHFSLSSKARQLRSCEVSVSYLSLVYLARYYHTLAHARTRTTTPLHGPGKDTEHAWR